MYFKENNFNQMVSRGRSDERVAGKINLQMGVMAVILFLGGIGVLLLAGMGQIDLVSGRRRGSGRRSAGPFHLGPGPCF